MWFDSHCHLFDIEESEPAAAVAARAREAGVDNMLIAGIDEASSRRAVELAESLGVVAAVGIHPNESAGWDPARMSSIEEMLEEPRAAAVGESGLDFYRESAPRDVQVAAFGAHLELARRRDKALVIHTRSSVDEALDMLEREGAPGRMVFHCWSGDLGQLELALGLGAYISFAGNVTFKSAAGLRALAEQVPDDRLLVETDSPYLAPVPHRGRPNEPAFVVEVGRCVAAARGVSEEDVAAVTSANARRLFGLE